MTPAETFARTVALHENKWQEMQRIFASRLTPSQRKRASQLVVDMLALQHAFTKGQCALDVQAILHDKA